MATFIITDDLKVKPNSFQEPFSPVEYEDFDAVKLLTDNVTRNEIMDLLKCSLLSTTPLTDVLLLKKQFVANAQRFRASDFNLGDTNTNDGGKKMKVKVMLRKSNNTVLFALGEEDFVDLVLSFLTFPLGGVVHMLNGNSSLSSIDNLYRSVLDLDPFRYMTPSELKDKLVKSQLAHQSFNLTALENFKVNKISKKYVEFSAPLRYLEPQSSTGEVYSSCGGRGFAKGPSLYMVTDDLKITPSSPVSNFSFLSKLRIPPSDSEEIVISIGKKEGLSLLRASLISSSALTNGFRSIP